MSRRRDRKREVDLNRVPMPSAVTPRPRLAHITLVEDRRLFHPEGAFRPPLSVGLPRKPRLVVPKPTIRSTFRDLRHLPDRVSHLIGFDAPKRVIICIRRKMRKEVLFATKGRGKGARSPKRRNYWSDVKC